MNPRTTPMVKLAEERDRKLHSISNIRLMSMKAAWYGGTENLQDVDAHWFPLVTRKFDTDVDVVCAEDTGWYYAEQGTCLAGTLIVLDDTYEGSGEDCILVQEAVRCFPELIAEVERLQKELHEEQRKCKHLKKVLRFLNILKA